MPTPEIILASASPRRRELLAEMGLRFEVVTSDVRELDGRDAPPLSAVDLAVENARRKAMAVAILRPNRWVLGADTVVVLGERLFGKPASLAEARDFLRALSGQTHEVITGCVLLSPDGKQECFYETSRVTFLQLAEDDIDRYLNAVRVLDKAGGYALQEKSEWIIKQVEGSRTNVIGLPTERLAGLCRSHGLL